MRVAGNIKSGTTANYSDDGVSQKTTIKSGVELADVIVPNPVKLRPYRTCLLYTSDAADEEDSVDLGGRRIIKKKQT